jgi:hypothetical protein
MSMTKRRWLYFVTMAPAVGIVIFGVWLYRSRPPLTGTNRAPSDRVPSAISGSPPTLNAPPSPNSLDPVATDEAGAQATIWQKLLQTPIDFSGKVVDQEYRPVEHAVVKYWIAEKLGVANATRETHSDRAGMFEINGVRGLGLNIEVSKSGYYTVKESRGTFGYATGTNGNRPNPTKDHPALFRLRKAGSPQKLIQFQRYFILPKDGSTSNVSLGTGELVSNDNRTDAIQIQSSVDDQNKNERREFDWHLTLTVPNGGFKDRSDEFDFEAPEGNYQSSVRIDMPTVVGTKWEREVTREYFVHVSSGYARISIAYVAGGHNRLLLRSWYNASGSRNLESDPDEKSNVLNRP